MQANKLPDFFVVEKLTKFEDLEKIPVEDFHIRFEFVDYLFDRLCEDKSFSIAFEVI